MKTVSISMISLVATTGLALAQGAPTKAGAGSAAPTKAAPAGAGAGSAAPAKAADPKAGGAAAKPAPPAPAPAPMKPPAEIAAFHKTMAGTWRCTGLGMGGADMKTEMKFKSTITSKVDLDGWWLRQVMNGTMGEGKTAMKFKMESFSTYDTMNKKWRSVSVMNDGSMMTSVGDGMKDGKMTSLAETWGPWGAGQMRDNLEMTDPKNIKMWGEASMDKGKNWMKLYEITCKK